MNPRVLVVDDNPQILEDFRKILAPKRESNEELAELESLLFGVSSDRPTDKGPDYSVDGALQGEEGLSRFCDSLERGQPYQVAVVDMQMPPGMDGVETIKRLRAVDQRLYVIVCTAHCEYSFDEIHHALNRSERIRFLSKPVDPAGARALVGELASRWQTA